MFTSLVLCFVPMFALMGSAEVIGSFCYAMWAHPVPTAILEPSKEAPIKRVLSASSLSSGYFFVLGRFEVEEPPLRV